MLEGIEITAPKEIEQKSFEILSQKLGDKKFPPLHEPIIKRVIHTTADLEYADLLKIKTGAVESGLQAIKEGSNIVTDTKMVEAGINKKVLLKHGGEVHCFIDEEDVARQALKEGITRAAFNIQKASLDSRNRIFAIGNSPTALIALVELIQQKKVRPALVVGVPVGFVNVVESKKLLQESDVPYILSEGQKGGSNVAAAIINAILYLME